MKPPKEYTMKLKSYQGLSDQQQSDQNLKRQAQFETRFLRTASQISHVTAHLTDKNSMKKKTIAPNILNFI